MLLEIPGYDVQEKLSENAAFKIFRGLRNKDLAPVLVKVLNHPYPTSKQLAPLWQEFEILRLLELPGVERAYALENHQQWWMIVFEDTGGQPINELEMAGRMEPEGFLQLALQLASTLEGIHNRQVVHKNISPANISFNPSTRQARLTNFGYASLISKERVPFQSPYKLAGSLAYTSPEMTGRINRSVDYRTDYYSLGATLYELLTGSPPFIASSPLELVHAHLAILPEPPASRMDVWQSSPAAFEIISAILFKLLAKNPEDRYQTPASLQADLRHCLAVLHESSGEAAEALLFVPGQSDRLAELRLQEIVIGRQEETDALEKALVRIIDGPAEVILVHGEAGVGKTTLVNQLIGTVTEYSGLFFMGKFDQGTQLNIYKALSDILEDFCRMVLSEPASSFEDWRDRIQMAVSPHGQLLTDLCPQLEKLIGLQPPVKPIDETLARSRFHRVVIRFLQALCHANHPVVLFLDDLQRINGDSCLLWQSLLSTTTLKNLLVIGVYRDDEVGPEHSLFSLIHEIEKTNRHVGHIRVENLEWSQLQTLVADALASDRTYVADLTTLIYMRTDGNPYFTIELLKSLYKDRLLTFNHSEKKWTWDNQKIKEYGMARNAVEFDTRQLAALDEDTQKVLQYAALIGARFDSETLLAIVGQEHARLLADGLWQAMRAELIHPLDENYRLLASNNPGTFSAGSTRFTPSLADVLEEQIHFEFANDNIQQAAIAALDERQIMQTSVQVGWLLLAKAEQGTEGTLSKNLLPIVDHLNRGSRLILDPLEAIRAAELNLMASDMVRALAAYKSATHYLSIGMQLLPENCWQEQYDLSLEIYISGAEIAVVNGDLRGAEALVMVAEENAISMLEKVRIMKISMDIYLIQNKTTRVIELGIVALRLLDFELDVPEVSSRVDEQMIQLSDMSDPAALKVSRLVVPLLSSAFAIGDQWLAQFVHFYINLFSRYGNPPEASFVYMAKAVMLLSEFSDVKQARILGRMALELAEKQGPSRLLYDVRFAYYAFLHHWLAPARESVAALEENNQPVLESGNIRYMINTEDLIVKYCLFTGYKLDQILSKYDEASQQINSLNLQSYRLEIWIEVILALMGESGRWKESGSLFDEELMRNKAGPNQIYLFNLYHALAFFNLLMRDRHQALKSGNAADEMRLSSNTHLSMAHYVYIYSLVLLSPGLDDSDLPARLAKVEENLKLMHIWAGLVPQNFLHQLELVEAEQARCQGRDEQAAKSYELAIQNARRNGYIQDSALAAELAAEFFLDRGQHPKAIDYLCSAYYAYGAWGAAEKISDLTNRYPDWLPPGKDDQRKDISILNEDRAADQLTSAIDLSTILKASLELSQETDLEELLRKMMMILIENAGAQNGSLLLVQNDRWFLKVQGSTGPENDFVLLSTPLEYLSPQLSESYVPVSIIHYVINLKTDLVLEDASTSRQFNRDAYIQRRKPKSVLCAPLLNQGILIGVVYLENNLTTGAFTSDRLEIVRLLSGQAAVSIEKARLYETMEAQVAERTRELSDTNKRLTEEITQRIRVEEALRLSEARYRTVFESTGTAMAVIDEDGNISLFNEQFIELTGYPRKDLENHFNSRKILSASAQSRIEEMRQVALNDPVNIPYSLEFNLVQNSGREIPVIATITALPGSQSLVSSLIDITKRKSAEEALRYNEALLRRVLEILPIGVWTLDKSSMVVSGNPEALRIWSSEERVDWQVFETYKAWHADTGKPLSPVEWAGNLAITKRQITLNQELKIEAFDGVTRFILNSAMPLITEDGELAGAIVVNQDITDRKSAEEALRYNEALLRKVLEMLPVGVWILDKEIKVIKGNPEAFRIWSGAKYVEREDFDQYKAWRLETGERVNRNDWAASRAIESGKPILNEELEIEAFDGTHRIILNSAIPLATEQDGLIGAIAINQDITERINNERELQEAHDQLSTLLEISQSIVSTLDLDRLLNLIVEQVGKVIPYEAASIVILEQDVLRFRVIHAPGPFTYDSLLKTQISIRESDFFKSFVDEKRSFYITDLQSDKGLLALIQDTLHISYPQVAFLRSWLGQPLIAKDELVGFLVLAHSQPDAYSPQSRLVSRAYANQVAIAIHNAQLYMQAGDHAALEERNRLARDLHDSVAQALYSISLFIDATRMALQTSRPRQVIENNLEELNLLSREAMSDMRLLIFELRPPDLEKIGLAAALHSRLESVETRAGFHASFSAEGPLKLSLEQETELYRIAQEALNNVLKHAHANHVSVRLVGEPDLVLMTIEDDGVGFESPGLEDGGGQGLRNMRERAAHMGAQCRFESIPNKGTKITIELIR